jgi:hypothetical protein
MHPASLFTRSLGIPSIALRWSDGLSYLNNDCLIECGMKWEYPDAHRNFDGCLIERFLATVSLQAMYLLAALP